MMRKRLSPLPATLVLVVLLATSVSMCVDMGDYLGGDAGPVDGVTLIIDFGDADGPFHQGMISTWIPGSGGGTGANGTPGEEPTFTVTTEDNDGRTIFIFTGLSSEEGTVLGLLEEAGDIAGFSVGTESYTYGKFVETIGGVECDDDGLNWLFWVNGVYGTLASDATEVEEGEIVMWRYMDPDDVDGDSGKPEEIGVELGEVGD